MEQLARKYIPGWLARSTKQWISVPRFWWHLQSAREAYRRSGKSYHHNVLFVAGLPKSGTSWMESMLASYPGYTNVMVPEAIFHEQKYGGSHDYQLSPRMFDRLQDALAVLKLHVDGAQHNVQVLKETGVPYLIMYRDLRDVAVSHYFYVRRTPWHPEHTDYKGLSIEEGLRHFGTTLLPEFVDWIRSWHTHRAPDNSLMVRYEGLLADTTATFREVAELFELPSDPETVEAIVDAHRFENLSGGRTRGKDEEESFFRKGVSGDWKNHFTPTLKKLFKEEAGQALIDFGYEEGLDW